MRHHAACLMRQGAAPQRELPDVICQRLVRVVIRPQQDLTLPVYVSPRCNDVQQFSLGTPFVQLHHHVQWAHEGASQLRVQGRTLG